MERCVFLIGPIAVPGASPAAGTLRMWSTRAARNLVAGRTHCCESPPVLSEG
jgi:hypothetical protein